jgi:hypothetical protein
LLSHFLASVTIDEFDIGTVNSSSSLLLVVGEVQPIAAKVVMITTEVINFVIVQMLIWLSICSSRRAIISS